MDYRDFLPDKAPPWMQDSYGRAYLTALGDALDNLALLTKDGVKARFPGYADEPGLGVLSDERGLLRVPGELAAAFAERLRAAWRSWPNAGTPLGLLQTLKVAGYTAVLEIVNGREYSLDGSGALVTSTIASAGWSVDATRTFWSKFDVLIVAPLPAGWPPIPGDSSPEAELVRTIVRAWKPAHATCGRIAIYQSGELWGRPTGLWGDAGTWAGGTVTYWTP